MGIHYEWRNRFVPQNARGNPYTPKPHSATKLHSATILHRHTLLAAPLISSASVVQIQRVYSNYALYLMCNFIGIIIIL